MDFKEVQRVRTRSTVMIVSELLDDISIDELISSLFVVTDDEESMKLVKKYEKIILKGKMDSDFLRNNLNIFYRDMSRYLKKHNLYKKFVEFVFFTYYSLSDKNKPIENRKASNIYQNILLQQYEYLSPQGQVIYGITTDGKLMTRKQRFPYSDYPAYEIERNKITDANKIIRVFKKYGYNDEMIANMEMFIKDDGLINNMTLAMVSFINENTADILPSEYMLPSENTNICKIVMHEDTEEIKERLMKRNYMLPVKGVLARYRNAGDLDSVFLKEVFQEDKMYVLYRLRNKKEEGMYGVYDIENDFFYSIYRDTSIEESAHNNIERLVLKTYSMLTTESTVIEDIVEVNNLDEIDDKFLNKPIVEFLLEDVKKNEKKGNHRHFDRRKYKESTVSINPYIRKLPDGAVASDEAIANARRFGYELSDDETFVTPFTRATFRNKD